MKQFNYLLSFEFHYHSRKPLFYIIPVVFAVLGFLMGHGNGILFPNVYINSPYSISYLTGLLSLVIVLPITIIVAQSILRETDAKFDALIYATSVSKFNYLASRFLALAAIPALILIASTFGIFCGHLTNTLPADKTGEYLLINYLWPFLVLGIPNILLCVSILCSVAWITKNKLVIYISGLLIYILYFLASIFSNSPLIAGSTPVSNETMSIFSKVDPFGMAAYFEQTRFFTSLQRNTEQLQLRDNFLLNRLIWLVFSIGLISYSYFRFSFRKINQRNKLAKIEVHHHDGAISYYPVATEVGTLKQNLQALKSFITIEISSILKGIPFKIVIILWMALFGIELSNEIKGDIRIGENFADTGLIINTIAQLLPTFALLVTLFYSSELLWRSKAVKFDSVEKATPTNGLIVLASKFISLAFIPFFLIALSELIGLAFQIFNQPATIDLKLYFLLFYSIGIPLLCCIALAILIQSLFKGKYSGLLVASIILLISSTAVGKMIGIDHQLLRFGSPLEVEYFDMNGFGAYLMAFNWYNCYYAAGIFFLYIIFSFKNFQDKKFYFKVASVSAIVWLAFGGYIFYQTNIRYENLTSKETNNRKQAYEEKYKKYENLISPIVTAVKMNVDLFPSENRYEVSGSYVLANHSSKPIDSVLLYTHPLTKLKNIHIPNTERTTNDEVNHHTWYIFKQPLKPGDSISMDFKFSSGWSAFRGHTPFNSIIDNGSFMRISNYFPSFGYKNENEIGNSIERKKRGMKPQNDIPSLESPIATPYDAEFISLDAVISTNMEQTAISSGDLIHKWTKANRNYFHYRTSAPIPFRFAISSAIYKVKRSTYHNIPVEVYYDSRHGVNANELLNEAKRTLAYCETNFGKYPHPTVRFAEISAFAEGFAATAYPGVIYMKENASFYTKLHTKDINGITMLAGHELSHQWWGASTLVPTYRQGGWILTETMANYTELMLYRKKFGQDLAIAEVRKHLNQYLSIRSFSKEMPLYKTAYNTPHLPYDKGIAVMHQLASILGENRLNVALKNLLLHYSYPHIAPTSLNLLNELYAVSTVAEKIKIDELFKQIITYDSKINKVSYKQLKDKTYEVYFNGNSDKFIENGFGKRTRIKMDPTLDVAVYMGNGERIVQAFPVINSKISGKITIKAKPVRIVIDPNLNTIDSFPTDNEKEIN
jgi:ABC-2 type transport system permease protein